MPPVKKRTWTLDHQGLLARGINRVQTFCGVNKITCPDIVWEQEIWNWSACAFYRPETIHIHLPACGYPCTPFQTRNWTWPGSTTDREPFGVLCHELGHHCDWTASDKKGAYFGSYSIDVRADCKESQLTSYCSNDAEWFAEMFRLFVSNHALLKLLRPRTWMKLTERWLPVSPDDWHEELGPQVPARVVTNLEKKIKAVK